jgi:hypothetical protein
MLINVFNRQQNRVFNTYLEKYGKHKSVLWLLFGLYENYFQPFAIYFNLSISSNLPALKAYLGYPGLHQSKKIKNTSTTL